MRLWRFATAFDLSAGPACAARSTAASDRSTPRAPPATVAEIRTDDDACRPPDGGPAPGPARPPGPAARTSRSARCCRTTRRGSATSGSTRGSEPLGAGVAFTAHDDQDTPAMVILLSEGAAADAAARDRLAGASTRCTSTPCSPAAGTVRTTAGSAASSAREDDDPVAPDDRLVAPWVALAYDGSPGRGGRGRAGAATRCSSPACAPQGTPSGPDFTHYWIDQVQPGLARLWPLPWPGRFDPGRLADDPGLLAADAAAGRARRADRDPDLPQPAAADTADADRRLGQPAAPVQFAVAAVRIAVAAVRLAVRSQSGLALARSRAPVGVAEQLGSPSPSGTESGSGQPSPRRPGRPANAVARLAAVAARRPDPGSSGTPAVAGSGGRG